jgi:hypothetical protein
MSEQEHTTLVSWAEIGFIAVILALGVILFLF